MSFGPTLYADRLYAESVYSGVPGTAMLSETFSATDSLTRRASVGLTGTMSLTDARTLAALRNFIETLSVFDQLVAQGQVSLSEFMILNEFLSPRLSRTTTDWVIRSGQSLRTTLTLYSQQLYAQSTYSGTSAMIWKAIALSTGPGFTNQDGHKN